METHDFFLALLIACSLQSLAELKRSGIENSIKI